MLTTALCQAGKTLIIKMKNTLHMSYIYPSQSWYWQCASHLFYHSGLWWTYNNKGNLKSPTIMKFDESHCQSKKTLLWQHLSPRKTFNRYQIKFPVTSLLFNMNSLVHIIPFYIFFLVTLQLAQNKHLHIDSQNSENDILFALTVFSLFDQAHFCPWLHKTAIKLFWTFLVEIARIMMFLVIMKHIMRNGQLGQWSITWLFCHANHPPCP